MKEKEEKMKILSKEIENCRKCALFKTRNNVVVGEGNLNAKIMFIGEAPGFNEDMQGKPFVGKAGRVLNELLKHINLKRENVYITSLLKCRPPNNRKPLPQEIKYCSEFLNKQISLINPEIICPLGSYAMNFIFKKYGLDSKKISEVHGRVFRIPTLNGILKIIPLFHPAFAVYYPDKKTILMKDFEVIKKLNK